MNYREQLFKELNKEEMEGVMKIFTSLEKSLLNILFHSQALSTKQIRNLIVDDMVNSLWNRHRYLEGQLLTFEPTRKELEDFRKEYHSFIRKRPSMYEEIEFKERLLVKYGQPVPSFKTIRKNITELEKLGFISRRELGRKSKEDCLWFMNPKFFAFMKRIKHGSQ